MKFNVKNTIQDNKSLNYLRKYKFILVTILIVIPLFVLSGCALKNVNKKEISVSNIKWILGNYTQATNFSDGIASVQLNGKWGFINEKGIIIAEPKYDAIDQTYAIAFKNGMAKVKLNNKWGFINTTGKEIIPTIYDSAKNFNNDLAPVELNKKWGYIDKVGKYVIPLEYDQASCFSENLAVTRAASMMPIIDKNDVIVNLVPNQFEKIYDNCLFDEGLYPKESNGKIGLIDKSGNYVIKPTFKDVTTFYNGGIKLFNDGLVLVKINTNDSVGTTSSILCEYIDKIGKVIIQPKYDDAGRFNEGLAVVEKNKKWGFIDKTGKEIIPLTYNDADTFYDGLARVLINGKYGYINKKGKIVIEAKYIEATDFTDNVALVNEKGKWGILRIK